jgi:hypothetical protein
MLGCWRKKRPCPESPISNPSCDNLAISSGAWPRGVKVRVGAVAAGWGLCRGAGGGTVGPGCPRRRRTLEYEPVI